MGMAHGPGPWALPMGQKSVKESEFTNKQKMIKIMGSSGLHGWIRLVEALWLEAVRIENGPAQTRNKPKRYNT